MASNNDWQAKVKGVRWVRLAFVDLFGTSHSLQLPAALFADAVDSGELFDGSALQGRARALESDMRLKPDPATLQCRGEQARVACTVVTTDGEPWRADPRTGLIALVDPAAESAVGDLAQAWTSAAELELYLLADGRPIDRDGYFDDREGPGAVIMREAAERLGGFGVEVLSCHHEAGPGQYEMDLAPLGPVALADALVVAKQTVREVAAERGVLATFMARPIDGEAGSGLHLHQEVDGLVGPGGTLTESGGPFVGGLLSHARALAALGSPTVNSYKRLHSGPEAPGAAVWAHVNRAALVRIGAGVHGGGVEYRGSDPSANPYLLVAGLLVAAADGMANELDPGPPVEEAIDSYDPAQTHAVRYQPLPRNLDDALDALVGDDVFVDAFDHHLLTNLVDGRRREIDEYRSHVTPWELERYLDEA